MSGGGWDLSLDAMTGLAHAFKTPEYKQYLKRFAASLSANGQVFDFTTGKTVRSTPQTADPQRIAGLINGAMATIDQGEPVWVNADVTDLIEYAAEHPSFEPQAIWLDDLWVPHAFCLFERPLSTIDIKGLEFFYRAISWSIVHTPEGAESAVLICKWSHRDDPDALATRPMKLIGGSPFTLAHVDILPFGEDRFLSEKRIAHSVAQFESLWRLSKQTVVVYGPERTSRGTWKRASDWRTIKEVTVLRLRRARSRTKYQGESGREMSYRTNTRGHWRAQYYPTLGPVENPNSHRQIWINEYIRGGEDKPLILKKHATEFTR